MRSCCSQAAVQNGTDGRGAVPLYSIEEVRLENNVIVNAFRYVSTADKPNQQYTSTDPVTKKAYTLKTINHGRIGYVYPNSEL